MFALRVSSRSGVQMSRLMGAAAVRSSAAAVPVRTNAFFGGAAAQVVPTKTLFAAHFSTAPASAAPKSRDELEKENAALRAEIETLKTELAKKPGKFMAVMSQYGLPFVAWWTTLWAASGVGIFFAIDTGLVAGGDAIDLIMSLGLDKFIDVERLNPQYGNLALAVIVNEAIEPLRFPLALATIPTIKRVFSKNKTPAQ